MRISALQKESFIDYPGKISAVLFNSQCNYHCPTCHAKKVLYSEEKISEKEILDYLDSRKGWINAVVLCGGESTIRIDFEFLKKIKERGLAIKLDTNGENFGALIELNESKLIDYVAMDVKGPPSIYADLVGREFLDARDGYEKSIAITSHFPDYEFRTTVIPIIRKNEEISFMTQKEIIDTAILIYNCTGDSTHKYFLQKFVSRNSDEMLDERFAKENLPEKMWETPIDLMENSLKEIKFYLPNTKIREQ